MELFQQNLRQSEIFGKVTKLLGSAKPIKIGVEGPSESQKAHYAFALLQECGIQKALYVAPNEVQARKMYEDFQSLTEQKALYLPAQEYFLYDVAAKSYDLQHQRLGVLRRILSGDFQVLVISAETLAQRLPLAEQFRQGCFTVEIGQTMQPETLVQKLMDIGYERSDTVHGRGQFAVRGGILDVYPVHMANPVRMDFWGDDVDSLRMFDASTQRSIEELTEIEISPAREVFFDEERKQAIIATLHEIHTGGGVIANDISRFETDGYFPGIDRYIPLILNPYHTVLDYFPTEEPVTVILDEAGAIRENLEIKQRDFSESCKNMLEKQLILPQLTELYRGYETFFRQTEEKKVLYLKTIGNFKEEGVMKNHVFTVAARTISGFGENLKVLVSQIKAWKKEGYQIAIVVGSKGRQERMAELLEEQGVNPASIRMVTGALHKSFEYTREKCIVISDNELFTTGVKKGGKKGKRAKGKAIHSFTDLTPGDFIVHDVHGIGKYMGLEQVTVSGVTRDYIKIQYSDSGFLFVPTNQMDLVQKYIGAEGHAPRLSKLGSGDWNRAKKKVKESLRELAAELVALYAKRQASKGFGFSPDTVWQKEFEDAFPFAETEDQLQCIEEIKRDMEATRPMERLLCGDVGYGKTEVAMRAIFKAVMDSKQVAVLVPTTVLAQQHYQNFKQRFGEFPVKVDYICRFRSPAEQREIAKRLKRGEIDVLIGTHRLLQKDMEFKDLGLLVVDEEQRFGVAHKEKIKTLKPNVDILTLSATPIPRTLHMSMVQIRDISLIEEPPEERHPVQTYVIEHDPKIVREAIYRELGRKGQVFYLYNKVRTIDVKAMELQQMVPEARIAVAHGQMGEHELEQVMMAFLAGDYDILVCTTIIESGIDMANVNTIIMEDGDHLGLAQLYQLRGRVGRSNKMAYAYITYRKDKVLTEFSEKRLQTIREFTEFGSGFKIAMRDLEIRGAGNLLGEQQHGQMESVGYDMYVKLLDKAVRELKGDAMQQTEEEVTIDITITAYIDSQYILKEEERLEMYKKISLIETSEDVMDVRDELIDRYGDVPDAVENLISVAWVKALAKKAGFCAVTEQKDLVILKFSPHIPLSPEKIGEVMDAFKRKLLFNAGVEPYLAYRKDSAKGDKLLDEIEMVLKRFCET